VEAKKIAHQPHKGKESSVWKLGIELKRVSGDAKEPWLAVTKDAVQRLWEEEYKGKFGVPQGTTLVSRPRQPDDEFGSLSEHRKIRAIKPPANDTYQSFIDRDPEKQVTNDPLD
jgi:hypothetical protein